jgi:Parkin co-regulated protein
MKHYLDHVSSHHGNLFLKCVKCQELAYKRTIYNHLINCYHLGIYQCVYCRFGSNTFRIIKEHLADKHSSKMPLVCERTINPLRKEILNTKSSSIDSVCIKHLKEAVNEDRIIELFLNPHILRNLSSMTKLGNTEKANVTEKSELSVIESSDDENKLRTLYIESIFSLKRKR